MLRSGCRVHQLTQDENDRIKRNREAALERRERKRRIDESRARAAEAYERIRGGGDEERKKEEKAEDDEKKLFWETWEETWRNRPRITKKRGFSGTTSLKARKTRSETMRNPESFGKDWGRSPMPWSLPLGTGAPEDLRKKGS